MRIKPCQDTRCKRQHSLFRACQKEVDVAKKIRVAIELAERINKTVAGHDGDEETGIHDEDCQKCMLQELLYCLVDAEFDVSD